MTVDAMRTFIIAVLFSRGWVAARGHALGEKVYDTACGPRCAHAWLTPGDTFNATLQGVYHSEGRNILAPHGELIALPATPDTVRAAAHAFCDAADAAVAQSYAARLLTLETV